MYRIRFHGRGGQGMKTAGRLLGSTFFNAGFNIQDAPRYGAERRGAPIFSYVRASRETIYERGIIVHPDLIIVADESLFSLPAVGIMDGVEKTSIIFIVSDLEPEIWKKKLNTIANFVTLPWKSLKPSQHDLPLLSPACAAAAACLCGLTLSQFNNAVKQELTGRNQQILTQNIKIGQQVFSTLVQHANIIKQGSCAAITKRKPPQWIDIPFDKADISSPSIHIPRSSEKLHTGSWRTQRPVIDLQRCTRCSLCNVYCPDSAISQDKDGYPLINYNHCKGCLICKEQCPVKAIDIKPEHGEIEKDKKNRRKP